MTVKLIAENGIAKSVTIDCTPLEYIVLNKALRHYADINAKDIEKAQEMLEQAQAIYTEEGGNE